MEPEMFRRQHCSPWQDLRDLDEPGTFRNECKSLLDQIINFTYSEDPIYGEAFTTDVEKQDASYRLLEEENSVLKKQVMSLKQSMESKMEEITELKSIISQLQNNKQDDSRLEEVSLPDMKNIIKRMNSTIEDIIDVNNNDGLGTVITKNSVLNIGISDSVESDNVSNLSSTNASLSVCLEGDDNILSQESLSTTDSQLCGSKSNLNNTVSGTSKEDSLLKLEGSYYSLKRENSVLQDKIKTFADRVVLLKTSLKSCELEFIQYDKILSLIKQERLNLISELRETKHCSYALKSRNEYLEEKVVELENRLKSEIFTDTNQREDDDCAQIEVLNCYKNRLYEAFKEISMKEEKIGQLNDSIQSLVEKFKWEKTSLEMEYADHLKESEDRLKMLFEGKVKLEETIRQQSKLIDHLQAMVESREKKHNSKINCLKDN